GASRSLGIEKPLEDILPEMRRRFLCFSLVFGCLKSKECLRFPSCPAIHQYPTGLTPAISFRSLERLTNFQSCAARKTCLIACLASGAGGAFGLKAPCRSQPLEWSRH